MSKEIGNRIKSLLETKNGGNQSELARFCGVSPQAVQKWITGDTSPGKKNIKRAAEFLGVTPAELHFGAAALISNENIIPANVGTRKIPLISYVQAGDWVEVTNSYPVGDAHEWLLTDLDLSSNAFALEIKGESMLPDFKPGDRVIIDPEVLPTPGDFVVARNGVDEATFKKYRPRGQNEHGDQVVELVPLNNDFPSIRSDITPFVIIGTMVEFRRYRKKAN